jgi:phenylpropionate dioxygenase-like ring-hydroxylating dioxygenase large terminal subunit
MQHDDLVAEAKILLDLVQRKTCSLADRVMEIHSSEYSDPALFARERLELFRNYPQFIGPSCMLPSAGDFYAFDDTGIPLLIVRKADGGLGGYLNICSHRGAPLGEGLGQAKKQRMLSCPYHAWSYDLDGKLIGVPFGNEGFRDMDRASRCLTPVQVAERDGMIFAMPNPELSFDIGETLGGIGAHLADFGFQDHHLLGIKRVETNISWKLNMDTFHEFYHFEALHPETIAQMSYNNICNYRQFGRNHGMSSPSLRIGELLEQDEAQWNPREYMSFVDYIFPNTVIFVVGDHFQTWRVYPVNERKSVVYHSMFLPEAPRTEAERAEKEAFFQMINDVAVTEDYSLVERIQRSLDAGLDRSVLVGRNEPGVQNMHQQIRELLPPAQVLRMQEHE